jgi:hypothetical protein
MPEETDKNYEHLDGFACIWAKYSTSNLLRTRQLC